MSKQILFLIFSFFLNLNLSLASRDTGLAFKEFANNFTNNVISTLGTMFMAAAFAIFFFGVAKYIWTRANDQANAKAAEEAKNFMLWGVIALFVMVSVWGIIQLAQKITNFGGSNVMPLQSLQFKTDKTDNNNNRGSVTPLDPDEIRTQQIIYNDTPISTEPLAPQNVLDKATKLKECLAKAKELGGKKGFDAAKQCTKGL